MMTVSAERVALQASLRKAKEFTSPEALQEYLKEHPKADPKHHKVVESEKKAPKPEEEPKPETGGKPKEEGRLSVWKNRFKSLSEKAQKFVEQAPKTVKHFLGNDEFRKAALKEAQGFLRKTPKKVVASLINTAKHEVHEFKTAAEGVKNLMSGKKMSTEQKKAFKEVATHMAIGAAAAALAASGPLMGAGMFAKGLATRIAAKSVANSMAHLHLLGELGHVGHGVAQLMSHIAAEDQKSLTPEEAMAHLIMASVAKEIEKLTDEDLAEALEQIQQPETEKTASRVITRYLKATDDDILTLAVDFDGVINSYKSGWTDNTLPDPPVPGAIEWLNKIILFCKVIIHSARLTAPGQEQLVREWLLKHGLKPNVLTHLEFIPKPQAQMYLDDRALQFTGGNFPTLSDVINFAPWCEEESNKMAGISDRVAQRYITASDVRVIGVDFASGQEPTDDFDPEFAALVEVTVDVSGMTLGRLFGKQQRVIGDFLSKLKSNEAIRYLAGGGRVPSTILDAAKRHISNMIDTYAMDEFERGAKVVNMDLADNTDSWEATIDPRKQTIRYVFEVDVIAKWD